MNKKANRSAMIPIRSQCPTCGKAAAGAMVENDGGVFLQRKCSAHGASRHLLSQNPTYFGRLREYYFSVIDASFAQTRYLLLITGQCNLNCPICFYGGETFGDITQMELREILRSAKGQELVLFGKEPSCRPDLMNILTQLRTHQQTLSLYTNGIAISQADHLAALTRGGVTKFYLQFDGFSDVLYEEFRGREMLDIKRRALKNLEQQKSDTVINMTVAKGVNEDQLPQVLDYALTHNNIKTLNLISYCRSGHGRNYLADNAIMPDEVLDMVIRCTGVRIRRERVFIFQKLMYAYMSFLKRRTCFYIQYFWLYRTKGGYLTIDEILDLEGMEPCLDVYQRFYKKNALFARIYLALALPRFLLKWRTMKLAGEFMNLVLSHITQKSEYSSRSAHFLQLIFSTACDAHKADGEIAKRCHVGVIYKDANGQVQKKNENSFHLLKLSPHDLHN